MPFEKRDYTSAGLIPTSSFWCPARILAGSNQNPQADDIIAFQDIPGKSKATSCTPVSCRCSTHSPIIRAMIGCSRLL